MDLEFYASNKILENEMNKPSKPCINKIRKNKLGSLFCYDEIELNYVKIIFRLI
jgi:hypothetical protein